MDATRRRGEQRRATLLVALVALLLLSSCRRPHPRTAPELILHDGGGRGLAAADVPEVGDSWSVGLEGLEPGERVELYLEDDLGREWSYALVHANREGVIEPFVFWFHSGVIGVTSLPIDFVPEPSFRRFEEAEEFFAEHPLTLRALDADGRLLVKQEWTLGPRRRPMIHPSNADGVLMSSIHSLEEDVFVTGRSFPPGATVYLALVPNAHDWQVGDPVNDVTGADLAPQIEKIALAPGQTSFTVPVWSRELSRPGAYDLVARIGEPFDEGGLQAGDVLSYGADTGVVLYAIVNGNVVIDVSGRIRGAPAKFEFSDSFEKGQDVYGAVDPTDLPPMHMGGNYAAYYVVADQDAAYWDGASPALIDVSGGYEVQRVKYWCINLSRRKIWAAAGQPAPIAGYDVVVDFGSTPAMTSADFSPDGVYTKGVDFLDGYDDVGFYVFEDPASTGPFPVGSVELDEPNGITGMPFDPNGMTGPNYVIDLAWGFIMYPAAAAGTAQPVSNVEASYPVALFLHGRHANCDSNGSAAGGTATYEWPGACADANRIPNHRGYDYILERLASQGIIAVSIDAFEIQPDQGLWNYDVRGRLVLRWLDKLRDWNDNGTDPFGGIFQGKIDLDRVALSGHSRGGEGVVAAQHLNKTWPTPHGIAAVNAIAPTDQNWLVLDGGGGPDGVYYPITDAPYYATIGARDGDIDTYHGILFYDRAFPEGMADRKDKAIAFVYGANHNFFNTVWTPAADLGAPNPWAGTWNDGPASGFVMSSAAQRAIARTTIAAFFRRYLQGLEPYKEIFTGRVEPAAIDNARTFWSYQDRERLALDDFEQLPQDPAENSQGAPNVHAGFALAAERLLNFDRSSYDPEPPSLFVFHDTLGLKLEWNAAGTLTAQFPAGIDATPYTHLTFRAGKFLADRNTMVPAVDLNLLVNVEDGDGDSALWDLRSDQFDPIPHPYWRSYYPFQMSTVRIPLKNFVLNNSGVDLSDLRQVTIRTVGSDQMILDDLELGR